MIVAAITWKKGTLSIIMLPLPPLKMLPPSEYVSWLTMQLRV